MRHVFLIPGFFGFSNIGRMRYFEHVHMALGTALDRAGAPAQLHDVVVPPTGSLQRRAGALAERVMSLASPEDELHFVGRSTGGLDARLLMAPDQRAVDDPRWAALAPRVRSVVCVATPHHGASIADFFLTLQGERWLRLLSLLTLHVVRLGSAAALPAGLFVAAAARASAKDGDLRGLRLALGELPEPEDSDVIVPTLSQVYGELLHVANGDHLDVLGFFNAPQARPPHVDWIRTGSGYSLHDFEATWAAAARFIAGPAQLRR